MRNKSLKRQRLERQWKPMHDEFREAFPMCMCCEQRPATDIHEIARGAHRTRARGHREALLHLCRICHDEMADPVSWPLSRQAALKLCRDPAHVSLELLCEIRGRAATDLTLVEVAQYLEVVS